MAVNIFNIEPNVVSTDVRSYSLLLVGQPKIGKSTFMHKLFGKRTLFIETEKRFGTLDGAYVAYVSSWADFLMVLDQLNNPKAKEMYDNVVVDTLDNLQRFCDDYVVTLFNEEVIGENNHIFGQDYKRAELTWNKAFDKLEKTGLNYAAIAHDKPVTVEKPLASLTKSEKSKFSKDEIDRQKGVVKYTTHVVDLENRYNKHIEQSYDNVVYTDFGINKEGENQRVLYLRGGLYNCAKCTLTDLPSVIPFDVQTLKDTFAKSLSEYDNTTEDVKKRSDIKDTEYNYEDIMKKIKKLSDTYLDKNLAKEAVKIKNDVLGEKTVVEDISPSRVQELAVFADKLENNLPK